MKHEVQPPIFVAEGSDVSVYSSLDVAVLELEGIDVDEGVYKIFDAVGRRITLKAEDVRRGAFTVEVGTAHVRAVESQPTGVADLRELLIAHLRGRKLSVNESWDLATLVRTVAEFSRR